MPSSSENPTLSYRINAATRPLHSQLNALILALLPLALLPHELSPGKYAAGLSPILLIYAAFEAILRSLLSQNENYNKDDGKGKNTSGPLGLLARLQNLHIPALERTVRLKTDIERILQQQSQMGTMEPKMGVFIMHINSALSRSPHLLLAYTWIFYMALFSGGRHIRLKLRQAGPGFWGAIGDEEGDVDSYLSFWTFEGDKDGEDIKADFKGRFNEVEECMTEEEKKEVVGEAVIIMESMIKVVNEITETVGDDAAAGQHADTQTQHGGNGRVVSTRGGFGQSLGQLLLKYVLPTGIVELFAGMSKAVGLSVRPHVGL